MLYNDRNVVEIIIPECHCDKAPNPFYCVEHDSCELDNE